MTEKPKLSYNADWLSIEETRNWQAVTDPSRCERIARKYGKKLLEVIDTGKTNTILRYICIFEDEDSAK